MRERLERLDRIGRDIREAKASTGRLDGRKMLPDLEYLLGMDHQGPGPTSEPRIWRRSSVEARHWWWVVNEEAWSTTLATTLLNGDIFVAGCHPRPDTVIKRTSCLHACTTVDWGAEKVEDAKPAEPEPAPGPTSEPRVWTGRTIEVSHWWWNPGAEDWGDDNPHDTTLRPNDIFVASCHPKPTAAPGDLKVLHTCTEVDWKVETA